MYDPTTSVQRGFKLSLPQLLQPLGDLVGGYVFDVGGDGPLVAVGVGDAGQADGAGWCGLR